MRKLTIEMVPQQSLMDPVKDQLPKVEWVRVLDILRLDFDEGVTVALSEIKLTPGHVIEDIEYSDGSEILAILKHEGQVYTTIAKLQTPDEFKSVLDKLKLDLVWDTPLFKSRERIVMSVIGADCELRRFLANMKSMGEVTSVKFSKPTFKAVEPMGCLTSRQREVLVAAYENGYYDYPRKVNAGELASKLGLNKATVIEHLRKAEGRMMAQLMAGF